MNLLLIQLPKISVIPQPRSRKVHRDGLPLTFRTRKIFDKYVTEKRSTPLAAGGIRVRS